MKKFTKIVSLLAASALLILLPDSGALKADAHEPTTYTIGYVNNEWGYIEGNDINDDLDYDTDFDELYDDIRSGDSVVIFGNSANPAGFDFPASLKNLTIMNCDSYIIITARAIAEFYAGNNTVAAVNANIQDAYVYTNAQVTFNNNVNNLTVYAEQDADDKANVSCKGTVGHAVCYDQDNDALFDIYNVQTDKLLIEESSLMTEEQYYSKTPAAPVATPAPQPSGSSSNDYDDVPKTGDSYTVYLLLAAAALCFAGSRAVKRI